MSSAIRVEWWKLRRSTVTISATILMAVLLPAMALGLYSVAQNGGTGPLAEKASAFAVGEGWVGYLGVTDQIAAVAIFLGAGVVVAWVFGREHSDRTFPSLFALPVSRSTFAGAKFLVLLGWIVVLSSSVVVVAVGIGLLAGVGANDSGVIWSALLRLFVVALTASTLALTMGLVASIGRGYLPAVGALILIVAAAQVTVLFGTGGWFPFAVPGLIAIAGADGAPELNLIQIALVPMGTLAVAWLTVRWWQHAQVV
ncbi:MAG: ABC transporter permease [Acidimicrobiia bacterium]